MENKKNIMVIGGGGYVGSALVPTLTEKGNNVSVFDTFWYGENFPGFDKVKKIKGDIRDRNSLVEACKGADDIIHLACISNDPSFDLNPTLGKSINLDAFSHVLDAVREGGASRFIYASSSAIYGIKGDQRVTEECSADPITDYAKYKWECEEILRAQSDMPPWTIIRPATVCGYAPRVRLDVVVNILTTNALEKGVIKVFGGKQMRSNIHINDMVGAYETLLTAPEEKIAGKAFNAGSENHSVEDIAKKVRSVVPHASLEYVPSNDNRSYQVDSEKIARELGFRPKYTIEDAVRSIVIAHNNGQIIDGLNNPQYHNIKKMKELNIC